MARERLKKEELDRLLTELFGERRLLMYKLDRVREAISELKALRESKEAAEAGIEAPEGEGAKAPRGERTKRRRKPGRRKKRVVVGGYRLNDWDHMVVGAVKEADRLLTKEELRDKAAAWAKKAYPKLTADDLEVKLTRTLQKLSGKRGVLGKHRTGLQRGLHYGVIDWFFNGKLRKENKSKVVVAKD